MSQTQYSFNKTNKAVNDWFNNLTNNQLNNMNTKFNSIAPTIKPNLYGLEGYQFFDVPKVDISNSINTDYSKFLDTANNTPKNSFETMWGEMNQDQQQSYLNRMSGKMTTGDYIGTGMGVANLGLGLWQAIEGINNAKKQYNLQRDQYDLSKQNLERQWADRDAISANLAKWNNS